MRTPLPYADFRESARALSRRDLARARGEAAELVREMCSDDPTHIVTSDDVMWIGYGPALVSYVCALCDEWAERAYRDGLKECMITLMSRVMNTSHEAVAGTVDQDVLRTMGMLPPWLNDAKLHSEHRARLLAGDRVWYGQWGWVERPAVARETSGDGGTMTTTTSRDELAERRNRKERQAMATRTALVEDLRAKGYDGPVSYTKTKLEEMVATLVAGGTIEAPKRGRKPRETSTNGDGAKEGD